GITGIQRAMRPGVVGQVREMPVVIAAVEQRAMYGLEQAGLPRIEMIGADQIERSPGLRFVVIMPARVVPAGALLYLLRRQPEEEEILLARLGGHLDGRAVTRADGEGAVHHELHVARAARLVARSGDLLGYIARGNQPLCQADVVFGQEEDLQLAACDRIGVDR